MFFIFFLILIIIYLLNEFNILNFKYFFISATFFSLLLSLDIIYQYFSGFDIIGLKGNIYYNTGFFGDEIIAGSFIQRFSFFSIFFITYLLSNKNNARFTLTTFAICVLGVGVLFSGNRMPLIIFFFGLLVTFLFRIKLKKIILVSLIGIVIIFNFIFSSNEILNNRYVSFLENLITIISGKEIIVEDLFINTPKNIEEENVHLKTEWRKLPDLERKILAYLGEEKKTIKVLAHDLDLYWVNRFEYGRVGFVSGHKLLFYTALDTWRVHKIFGNGIKSFRIDCGKYIPYPYSWQGLCSTHPHNYYLEILTEIGIIGFSLTIIFAVIFLAYLFKNFKFFKGNSLEEYILLSAAISLFLELFPFRSTGSLFSTSSATYIILVVSIILCHKKLMKSENSQ